MSILSALLDRHDPVESRSVTQDKAMWAQWAAGEDISGAGAQTPAGVVVNRHSALGISAVWACVGLISDSIATLPTDVIRRDGKGVEQIVNPRASWLDTPNSEQTKVDFVFNQLSSLLLHGTTYVYTVRDQRRGSYGDILEAWVLDPEKVYVRREFDDNGNLQLVYYVMVAKGQQSPVGPFRIPAGPEMFHIVGPQIHAGFPNGLPPLEVARMMYGGAIANQEMGARFYGQGMNASGVIEVPAETNMTTEQARQFKEDFSRANAGLKKMHLPPVLTGGATFKQVTISPEQSQFLQSREFSVDEIARWFRVPPHMIGHLVRSTSWGTGIEFQGMTFVNYTLRPWIERLEAAWTRWMLVFQPGTQVRFDVTGLLRGDHAARATYYQARFQTASITPNEIRAAEGEAPIADGDDLYYPTNMAPVGIPIAVPGTAPSSANEDVPDDTAAPDGTAPQDIAA